MAFELRPIDVNNTDEVAFVYEVRTHPDVSRMLFGSPPASFEQHHGWVLSNIDCQYRWMFLCLNDGEMIGYAQVYNFCSQSLEVGWALHPDFQGKGLGSKAVETLLHEVASRFSYIPNVLLEVKTSNEKAIYLYRKAGFFTMSQTDEMVSMARPNRAPQSDAKLTYVGHAGFLLELGDIRLLCDPWFHAAFYGSWYPYPYNRHMMEGLAPTHLYISHGHEDHYDKRFLSTLDKDTHVFAANFKNKEMQGLLKDFRNVVFLDHLEPLQLGDLTVQMFIDVTSPKNDSAISISFGDYKILDMNDCYLPIETIPKADMLWSQFSGAFHYPHCYDFDDATKQTKVKEVKTRYFNELVNKVEKTQCSTFIPFAGPACFLDPLQKDLNDGTSTIFYPWSEFEQSFAQMCKPAVLKPSPGHKAYLKGKTWHLFNQPLVSISMEQYRNETVDERQDYEAETLDPKSLEKYFSTLRRKHAHLFKLQSKTFRLVVGDKKYTIHLSPDPKTVHEGFTLKANYTFTVPTVLMKDILNGGRWDAAFLSNRIKLHRDVDVYDVLLFQILYADNFPERTKEIAQSLQHSTEMVKRDGYCYQRYCPHAGADLSTAKIENGILECPRHNWKWDLSSGKCLVGSDVPLHCNKSRAK